VAVLGLLLHAQGHRPRLENALREAVNLKVDQLLIVDLGGNEDAAREAATTLALGCRNKGTVLWSSEPRGTTFSAGFNGAAAGCAAEALAARARIPPQAKLQWGRGS
jgi:hypothetical protein